MKSSARFVFALGLGLSLFFSACSTCDCENQKNPEDLIGGSLQGSTQKAPLRSGGHGGAERNIKGILAASLQQDFARIPGIPKFVFNAQSFKGEKVQALSPSANQNSDEDDAAFVKSVFTSLLLAEDQRNRLNVEVAMSDAPIEDGVFVFSLKAENNQEVVIQMYDEEGFDMVANNKVKLNAGNNYRSLNVSELENGGYIFKVKNSQDGREVLHRVQLKR